jgi:hypothetical protein
MKKIFLFCLISIQHYIVFAKSLNLTGAWQSGPDENRTVMIVAGKFFSAVVYSKKDNSYIGTYGGAWRIEKNQFIETHEFNTMNPEWIGTEKKSEVTLKKEN